MFWVEGLGFRLWARELRTQDRLKRRSSEGFWLAAGHQPCEDALAFQGTCVSGSVASLGPSHVLI